MKIRECKAAARQILSGHYGRFMGTGLLGLAAAAVLLCGGVFCCYRAMDYAPAVNVSSEGTFSGTLVPFMLLAAGGTACLALLLIFTCLYVQGRCRCYLDTAKGSYEGMGTLFYPFKKDSGAERYPAAVLLMLLRLLLWGAALSGIAFLIHFALSESGSDLWQRTISLPFGTWNMKTALMIAAAVLFAFIALNRLTAWSMTVYVLCENRTVSAREAIRRSVRLMKGRKLKCFWCFTFGFLPWLVLCLLTFGVLGFWVLPYFRMIKTVFYLEASETERVMHTGDTGFENTIQAENGEIPSDQPAPGEEELS